MQEDHDGAIYISKCASHIRPRVSPLSSQGRNDLEEAAEAGGGYASDEDNNSVLKKWPEPNRFGSAEETGKFASTIKNRIRCRRCLNPDCHIKKFNQSRFRIKNNPALNNLDKTDIELPNYNSPDLSESIVSQKYIKSEKKLAVVDRTKWVKLSVWFTELILKISSLVYFFSH